MVVADTRLDELSRAYAAFSRGSLDESSKLCGDVLLRNAGDAQALHLAAAIALRRGDPALALERVTAAIHSAPREARQYQTRGLALRMLKRAADAEANFREALRLAPDFADARASLAVSLLDHGDHVAARQHLEEALRQRPGEAEWRYNLALCRIRGSEFEAARRELLEVLRERPEWPDALTAMGGVFMQLGETEGAEKAFRTALRFQPQMPQAWNNLGTLLASQGRGPEARDCFNRCLALAPSDAHAWSNLGNTLRRGGDPAAAEQAYRQSVANAPKLASAWQNLGNNLREQGRFREAIECLERAVSLSGAPECHLSLAVALLCVGNDLGRAWSEYRWRHGVEPSPTARATLHEAIVARRPIELAGEQGLGDALFFLRWAPLLGGASLRWRGDRRLAPLLEKSGLFASFCDEASPPSTGALAVPLGDLPALLGGELETYPPPLALNADSKAMEAARELLATAGPRPYVGVAWRSGTVSQTGEELLSKNVPVEGLGSALRGVPGTVVSVQRQPHAAESAALAASSGRPVLDASHLNENLGRMMGLLSLLDHYVGVSSTNVHLTAGLGKAASILVPHPPEWRYGHEGASSPWFPSFRVYREHPQSGWDEALASLGADLGVVLRRK